jgi:hypothetical protein
MPHLREYLLRKLHQLVLNVTAQATDIIVRSFINILLFLTSTFSRLQSGYSQELHLSSNHTAHESHLTWLQPGTPISHLPII